MAGWHHQLNGHEFEQAPGDGEEQGSLVCCSPWGRKESDTTEKLNNNKQGRKVRPFRKCKGKNWSQSMWEIKTYFLFFFSFLFISWRLITLQYCSGFCPTLTWISHGFTCIPHPDPPSHLPLYRLPLGSTPGLSTCLMHPTWTGDLFLSLLNYYTGKASLWATLLQLDWVEEFPMGSYETLDSGSVGLGGEGNPSFWFLTNSYVMLVLLVHRPL